MNSLWAESGTTVETTPTQNTRTFMMSHDGFMMSRDGFMMSRDGLRHRSVRRGDRPGTWNAGCSEIPGSGR